MTLLGILLQSMNTAGGIDSFTPARERYGRSQRRAPRSTSYARALPIPSSEVSLAAFEFGTAMAAVVNWARLGPAHCTNSNLANSVPIALCFVFDQPVRLA